MAEINDCVPGRQARVLLKAGVARVVGKTGTIVEVSRISHPRLPDRSKIGSRWTCLGTARSA